MTFKKRKERGIWQRGKKKKKKKFITRGGTPRWVEG